MSRVCQDAGTWVLRYPDLHGCVGAAGGMALWVPAGLGHRVVCGPSSPGIGSPSLAQAAAGGAGLPGPTAN